jgi:glycosyltransferase involved in cell wall biosynthesis
MKKLTIVFTTSHADTLGNACRLDMISFLTKHFKSTILTNQPKFIKTLFPDIVIIPINTSNKGKLPVISSFRYYKQLAKEVNKIQSDGVFIFNDESPSAIWIKSPVFQYIHQYGERNNNGSNSIKKLIKKNISFLEHKLIVKGFKKSELNFVVSTFLIDYFKNEGVRNLSHIPHAMDIEKFRKPLLTKDHERLKDLREAGYFIVSYTGWVTENRGYQLMMDAIKEAVTKDNKIVLVIAGANEVFSKRIFDFQKKNNLEKNIINYGVVDSSLTPGILYYSDVCLSFLDNVPAHLVSPPQKIFEYFASGKPVICNDIQTHTTFVNNGETGFIVNLDSKEVSSKILALKENLEKHKEMCVNAEQESLKYEISNVYGEMIHDIKEVLNEY